MDRRDDVPVVGGGPAGLTAAALLALPGVRVAVLEQRTEEQGGVVLITTAAARILQEADLAEEVFHGGVGSSTPVVRGGGSPARLFLGEDRMIAMARQAAHLEGLPARGLENAAAGGRSCGRLRRGSGAGSFSRRYWGSGAWAGDECPRWPPCGGWRGAGRTGRGYNGRSFGEGGVRCVGSW